jgi:hypothetical protein
MEIWRITQKQKRKLNLQAHIMMEEKRLQSN